METKAGDSWSGLNAEGLPSLPVVPAVEFAAWRPSCSRRAEKAPNAEPAHPELSEAELRYLRAVLADPGRASSIYVKPARLSPSRATVIRIRLVEAGYLRVHEVATGKRGRNALIVEPLEPAKALVDTGGQK